MLGVICHFPTSSDSIIYFPESVSLSMTEIPVLFMGLWATQARRVTIVTCTAAD